MRHACTPRLGVQGHSQRPQLCCSGVITEAHKHVHLVQASGTQWRRRPGWLLTADIPCPLAACGPCERLHSGIFLLLATPLPCKHSTMGAFRLPSHTFGVCIFFCSAFLLNDNAVPLVGQAGGLSITCVLW